MAPRRSGGNGGTIADRTNPNRSPRDVKKYDKPSHYSRPETGRNIAAAHKRFKIAPPERPIYRERSRYYYEHHYRNVEGRHYYHDYYWNSDYRYYYSGWYRWGFYGGYWYPVRSCYIHYYFHYPVVFWLWNPYYSGYYDRYRYWYGTEYDAYPVQAFNYVNVYYPTDTIRDMAIEVSAMPTKTQGIFRTAMTNLTNALVQQISNNLGVTFTLSENDVVVNHYENLQNRAIMVEGFVNRDNLNVAFKGFIDLEDASQTLVFVPTGANPAQAELDTLTLINNRISALGGNPFQAAEEPTRTADAQETDPYGS